MTAALRIFAGNSAYQKIQKDGLQATDVAAVIGASGAAKWLAITHLDSTIFSQWLNKSTQTIDVLGTSIGAIKLAAALRRDPAAALTKLADDYVAQSYGPDNSLTVTEGTYQLLNSLLVDGGAQEILQSPRYRYHCIAVRCKGGLASNNQWPQKLSMASAFFKSMRGRDALSKDLQRVVFSDPRSTRMLRSSDGYVSERVELTQNNFDKALLSSGSIPVYMDAVNDVAGDGVFRDGGLLDYHPVPDYFWPENNGLVLYPHFYQTLKAGWFDKFFPWRHVPSHHLDNVVMLAPSDSYIASLPGGKIPERQDFVKYQHNQERRRDNWREVIKRSEQLGEEFLKIVESGDIASHVQRFA